MKQDRLTKHTKSRSIKAVDKPRPRRTTSIKFMDIDLSDFKSNPLWPILVDTIEKSPLYNGHVGYYRNKILPSNPDITPEELAHKLSITIGEALVILNTDQSE
ncbi:MAG: hypothetical protein ACFFF4_03355 [Candidatus Thorarchaeota archaeon]